MVSKWYCVWGILLSLLTMSGRTASGQINEDYTAGDPSGWTNLIGDLGQLDPIDQNRAKNGIIDISTFQIGRMIVGDEPGFPHPITGGNGPTVLTYNIREPINAPDEEWDVFQKAARDFQFSQNQFQSHVIWVEFSSFSNVAGSSTELVKLDLTFEDALGVGVRLGNNFNTRNSSGQFGTRANQSKPRRALLKTDEGGQVETDPETGLPIVRDVIDGNAPDSQLIRANLNYVNFPTDLLPISGGDGVEDEVPNELDGGQKILNTLFDQRAVIRLEDFANFNFEVEWKTQNPDATGDGNWRSLKSTGLGAGTELADPESSDSLILTETLGDIQSVRLQATRRDLDGFNGLNPPTPFTPITIHRAAANIDTNPSSTNGVPDNQATANQQVGLGRFVAQVYHRGDLDRSGSVTVSDLTAGPILGNLGLTEVEDASITIGDQTREVAWVDGDTVNSGRITVADALAGVLTGLAGPAPTGPELIYTSGTGNLKIDTAGHSLSGFALVVASDQGFNTGAYVNPNPSGSAIETVESFELSWMNLTTAGTAAGANLTASMIDLGNVLPMGLTNDEFEGFFREAVFNVGDALSKANSFFAVEVPLLAGDYNDDGVVDAADYTVWRDALGSTMPLANDPLGGTIGAAQYEQWRDNFGATQPAALEATAVPEPAAGALLAGIAAIALLWWGVDRSFRLE